MYSWSIAGLVCSFRKVFATRTQSLSFSTNLNWDGSGLHSTQRSAEVTDACAGQTIDRTTMIALVMLDNGTSVQKP